MEGGLQTAAIMNLKRMPICLSTFTLPLHIPPPILPFVYIHSFFHLSWPSLHIHHNMNLIFSNFFFLFVGTSDERLALNVCRRLLQELNQTHWQIFNPNKNQYHQNPDRLNKSYLDQPYSVTKLLTVALEHPDKSAD